MKANREKLKSIIGDEETTETEQEEKVRKNNVRSIIR